MTLEAAGKGHVEGEPLSPALRGGTESQALFGAAPCVKPCVTRPVLFSRRAVPVFRKGGDRSPVPAFSGASRGPHRTALAFSPSTSLK